MKRTALVAGTIMALVAALLIEASPAGAQAPAIPANPQITDPGGDANLLNDQDNTNVCPEPPCEGDTVTPADPSTVSDLLAGWFTHTTTTITLHIQTERAPPASSTLYYRMAASPTADEVRGCLNIRAIFPGQTQGAPTSTYIGEQFTQFEDTCNAAGELVPGEIEVNPGPEVTAGLPPAAGASGITSLTFPRSASPLLANGKVITQPYLISRLVVGTGEASCPIPPSEPCWFSGAQLDNTVRGSDYAIGGSGGGGGQPSPTSSGTGGPQPTATASSTPTPTSSASSTPAPSPTASNTPNPSPTATNSPTPEPTATPSPGQADPGVQFKVSSKTPKKGSTIRASASLSSCEGHANTTIELQRKKGSAFVRVTERQLNSSCSALFKIKVNFKKATFRAFWPQQDTDHRSAASKPVTVRAR